jgi:serine/threonine-protein kinase
MYNNLADVYGYVGMVAAAERAKCRSAELIPGPSPEKFEQELNCAWLYHDLTGSFEKLEELLTKNASSDDPNGHIAAARFDVRMAQRKYADAERAIASSPVKIFEVFGGTPVTKNYFLGVLAMVQGDMQKAGQLLERELEFARKQLNEAPDSESRHAQVGLVCAYLGRKEEAIAEGKRAVELMPVTKDAIDGPNNLTALAEIYGRIGEPDKAIDLLEKLLIMPAGVNQEFLKTGWYWDPLRNNPRFQKLISGPPPKIVYN